MFKKTIAGFLLGTIFVLALFPAIFYFNLGKEHPKNYFLKDMLIAKERVISSPSNTKIAFLGGSSTLRGINTARISEAFQQKVINLGFHAGFLGYLLDSGHIKKYISKGDVLILPLEYYLYSRTDASSAFEWLSFSLGYDEEYMRTRPLEEKVSMWYTTSLKNWLLYTMKNKKIPVESEYIYNEYGDWIGGTQKKFTREKLIEMSKSEEEEHFTNILNHKMRMRLHDFLVWCRLNDVKVYASFPPYFSYKGYFADKELHGIEKIKDFYRQEGIEMLNEATDTLYPVEYFFDSMYHLNGEGKEKYTDYWINLLEEKGICKRSY